MSFHPAAPAAEHFPTEHRGNSKLEQWCQSFLGKAGVTINGHNSWDPQVHNERALRRMLVQGTFGAGESYIDGDWDCPRLDKLATRLLRHDLDKRRQISRAGALLKRLGSLVNWQSPSFAAHNVTAHYDIGNELYEAMLGPRMTYSCGYWQDASTLEEAQDAKHELICRKLGLREGMHVLDVGCGWGGFARYAAERHGVTVTGITLSPSQAEFARRWCAGLPVEILLQDYRKLEGEFERIVSVGMFEHVGPRNYRTYFEVVNRVLADDGLFLLHVIGSSQSTQRIERWMGKHIFPHAVLPSGAQIEGATEGLFVMEDWHNFGAFYDRTLMAWHANFTEAWPQLKGKYDERFHRMWDYYLLTCAGTFRARRDQLWQIVFSKHGVPGGYARPRVH